MSIGLIELIGVIELLSITSIKVRGLLMVPSYDLLAVDTSKLFCGDFEPCNELHVLAVFSQRILLEIVDRDPASSIAMEAVRKHVRVLTDIESDFISTVWPSEPALAVAAASALLKNDHIYCDAFQTLPRRLVRPGIVRDCGGNGGMCTSILLMLARDYAIAPQESPRTGRDFVTGYREKTIVAVTLLEFLNTLLGSVIEDNAPELREFRSWASKVHLNFTHFIQANNIIGESVSLNSLAKFWHRGAVIQCAPKQMLLDGFLVGYEGDLTEAFDKTRLVMIPWRTKCGVTEVYKATSNGLVCPFISSDSGYYKPKNHLVLYMDLRTSAPELTPDIGSPLNDSVAFSERRAIKIGRASCRERV